MIAEPPGIGSDVCVLERGRVPVLISLPHDGTEAPPGLAVRLTPAAACLPDTDWHVGRLYAFARELGASILRPRYTRYLIDLNRPPDDTPLYPGRNGTGLCPDRRFDGGPIYRDGQTPDRAEIAERVARYWQPYHRALDEEIERLRQGHGRVLLWEGHSIRGQCPYLFEGRLPDLNLGSADGGSCSPAVRAALGAVLAEQREYDWVLDGRFKGGYITRRHGRPEQGVEAVQLEIAQRIYMDEDSFEYHPDAAERLCTLLRRLIEEALRAVFEVK